MIVIIVAFMTASAPIGALRSEQTFATMELCAATLRAETRRFTQVSDLLSARLGVPVTFDARGADIVPGVPA